MRIEITKAREEINQETSRLGAQIASAEKQGSIMASISCRDAGLKGEGFEAVEKRIQMRPLILSAHQLAYEAIKEANNRNTKLLDALPFSSPGVLDTYECEVEIQRWERYQQQDQFWANRYLVLYLAEEGHDFRSQLHRNYTYYRDRATASEKQVALWRDNQQKALIYQSESAGVYDSSAQLMSSVLAQSTSAAKSCIQRGGYGTDDFTMLRDGIIELRLKQVKEYLTEEEYVAFEVALSNDGIIAKEEIYLSSTGSFNEELYRILMKLPPGLVTGGDVGAIAGAYGDMWLSGDTDSIESFIELSYVEIVGAGDDMFARIYEQTPLLDRVAIAMQEQLALIEGLALLPENAPVKGNGETYEDYLSRTEEYQRKMHEYQMLLAGTNLLNTLAGDEHTFWSEDGIHADLKIVESTTGQAVMCLLDFSTKGLTDFVEYGESSYKDALNSYTFCTISGDLNYAALLAEKYRKGELAFSEFTFYGIAEQIPMWVTEEVVGSAHPLGALFGPLVDVFEYWNDAKTNSVINDETLDSLAADGGTNVLQLFGFGLNLGFDPDTVGPEKYLDFKTEVYMTNDQRAVVDYLTESFSKSPEAQCLFGGEYFGTRQLVKALETNTANAVVASINNWDLSNTFLRWTGTYGDLVFIHPEYDSNGNVTREAGAEALKDTTNYSYAISKEKGNSDKEYSWEWKKRQQGQGETSWTND